MVRIATTLGELIDTIQNYEDPPDGIYMVCVASGNENSLNISMPASLLFYATDEDDEDFFDFLNASDLATLGGVRDIQYLISIAKEQAPHAGTEELLALVEQFLDQDGYLS